MERVTINPVEVAAELAEKRVEDEMTHRLKQRMGVNYLSVKDIEVYIYVQESEDTKIYTEEAQDLFNTYYDMYFEQITNAHIPTEE
jgi:hypothetical protein